MSSDASAAPKAADRNAELGDASAVLVALLAFLVLSPAYLATMPGGLAVYLLAALTGLIGVALVPIRPLAVRLMPHPPYPYKMADAGIIRRAQFRNVAGLGLVGTLLSATVLLAAGTALGLVYVVASTVDLALRLTGANLPPLETGLSYVLAGAVLGLVAAVTYAVGSSRAYRRQQLIASLAMHLYEPPASEAEIASLAKLEGLLAKLEQASLVRTAQLAEEQRFQSNRVRDIQTALASSLEAMDRIRSAASATAEMLTRLAPELDRAGQGADERLERMKSEVRMLEELHRSTILLLRAIESRIERHPDN